MLVQFGNNWIQNIPLTAKLDLAYDLVQFWQSSEFFSSNYFQIGQHVVLLLISAFVNWRPRPTGTSATFPFATCPSCLLKLSNVGYAGRCY